MMRLLLPLLLISALHAADSTIPGEVTTPFPTLNHLAIEWQIDGDDDLDAVCELRYRKEDETTWREGMPLRRVPAGKSQKTSPIFTWTNRLSGSVFDLEPGTAYEIELKLHDPDGGFATKVVKASTRPEPIAQADAVVKNASKADLNAVKPGEVLLLADGDYGAATFNRDGEPGKPIVYRSASGKAVFSEISLTNRKWVYLEGVTVNGPVRLNGSEHCVVRRCTIRSQFGLKAYKPGMLNACIEDNVMTPGLQKMARKYAAAFRKKQANDPFAYPIEWLVRNILINSFATTDVTPVGPKTKAHSLRIAAAQAEEELNALDKIDDNV
jgi:hypothetical protein